MFQKLGNAMRRFMAGRYGTDKLSLWALALSLVLILVGMVANWPLLSLLAYIPTIWVLIRTFSRNTYKRYRENQRFLQFLARIKDRENRYFACPKCHQKVRVPKGKGKISIKCPRCGERFIKKT